MATETIVYKDLYAVYKGIILYYYSIVHVLLMIMRGDMKATISGITGILIACLIIATVVIAPWTAISSFVNAPQVEPGYLGWALSVRSFVSNLTEPLGIGSEGILTVIVTSMLDASNVVVQFDMSPGGDSWPMGISFVSGNLTTWSGNLKANVSMIFNVRIRAIEAGGARLLVTAKWHAFEWECWVVRDMLFILVQDNDIQVSHDPITPPGYFEAVPFDGPPIWPNGTSWVP